jgi:ribosomal protein S18 acetylase RimI-like enzyme
MNLKEIENYQIENTSTKELNFIYTLFEEAITYIKKNNYTGWTTYDKNFIRQDIEKKLQFKITAKNDILCLYSICYTDALIWREMEKGDAIYLHRIVVNPLFKGQKQFDKILNWVKISAAEKGLKYIRMDTWAENPNIIEYYKSFGFKHIEDYTTPNTPELPDQHRNLKVALLEMKL